MKGLELIQNYPAAGKVVKEWFFKSMLESFKDETVPDEFKEFMLEQGIEDDKIGTLIDINPRMLIDVFLENNIQISINPLLESRNFEGSVYLNFEKIKSIENEVYKELEKEIITICFEELENIL